jgi:hypothetical protein
MAAVLAAGGLMFAPGVAIFVWDFFSASRPVRVLAPTTIPSPVMP